MQETALSVNLQNTNAQIDALNKNIDNLSNKVEGLSKSNEDANTKFLAMQSALGALGNVVPGLSKAMQTYTSITKIWGAVTKSSAESGSKAMKLFKMSLGAIGIVITAVAAIINTMKGAIENNAEATAKFRVILAQLDPILKLIGDSINYVVDLYLKLADTAINVGLSVYKGWLNIKKIWDDSAEEELKLFEERQAQAKEIAAKENQYAIEERQRIKERSESEKKQGELREEIADAEGAAKARYIGQLAEEIRLQAELDKQLLQKKIEIEEYKQRLTASSEAELKYLAELKAQLNDIDAQASREIARLTKQTKNALKQNSKEVKKETNDFTSDIKSAYEKQNKNAEIKYKEDLAKYKDNDKKKLEITKQYLEDSEKRYNAYYRHIKAGLEKELEGATPEEAKKITEQLETLEIQRRDFKLKTAESIAKTNDEIVKNEEETAQKLRNITNEQLKADEEARRLAREQKLLEIEEDRQFLQEMISGADGIISNYDMLDEAQSIFAASMLDFSSNGVNAFSDFQKSEKTTADKTALALKITGDAIQKAAKTVDAFNKKKQEQIKTTLASNKAQIEAELKAGKITEEVAKQRLAVEEETAKKEFEKTKKIQIAMAMMQTLGGIAGAIPSFMSGGIPMPAAAILGGIMAATIAATGAMQIAQIKKQTIEGGGDISTGAAESAAAQSISAEAMSSTFSTGVSANPLLDEGYDLASMSQTATTQGASATTDQRVYIVEDDIQQSNKRVQIREAETTF